MKWRKKIVVKSVRIPLVNMRTKFDLISFSFGLVCFHFAHSADAVRSKVNAIKIISFIWIFLLQKQCAFRYQTNANNADGAF